MGAHWSKPPARVGDALHAGTLRDECTGPGGRSRGRRLLVSLLAEALLAGGVGGVSAQSALADDPAPPPTLNGETFSATSFTSSSDQCTVTGGTLGYMVSGTASGPYSGTFTESGTATETADSATSFTASFMINSSAGSVAGSTQLGSLGGFDPCPVWNFTTTYTAVITTPAGKQYSDAGIGVAQVQPPPTPTVLFAENFTSNQTKTHRVHK